MNLQQLSQRALAISQKYDLLNEKRGVVWTERDFMAGFVGDVGDLSKLVMAKDGVRQIDDTDNKLAHELCDCLWSVLILANKYNVDLESEFVKTMDQLSERISKDL